MNQRLGEMLSRFREILLPQTAGQAVLAVGGLFLIGVAVAALLPDRIERAGGIPAQTNQPAVGPGGAVGIGVVMPGLQPFKASPPLQFGGRVTQVVSIGSEFGWGQVHIWINDGTGTLREISLAPQSYLQQIGCPPLQGARISGTGFLFDPTRPGAELYAKFITVGGVTCRLRDDEGLALWLNPTQ
jgi:hypothetical protein